MKANSKRFIPRKFVSVVRRTVLFRAWSQFFRRAKRRSYGDENPDKTFYVIGFTDTAGGIFWLLNKALMHISFAVEAGYIPVIDYKNYRTQYTGPNDLGKVNVWEKYFQQPFGYSLDDVYKSKNVILAARYPAPDREHFMGNFYNDKSRIQYFRYFFSKYIRYDSFVKAYLEEQMSLLPNGGVKTLGVLCRGTDYLTMCPKNHPIPPTPQQVIQKAKDVMAEHGCETLFLATEDEDVYSDFHAVFGERLIVNRQIRIKRSQLLDGQPLAYQKMQIAQSSETRFQAGLEYLCAIHLLSKCPCFIGTRCGGTKGALILSSGFQYEYTFDLGMYGVQFEPLKDNDPMKVGRSGIDYPKHVSPR